MLKFNKGGTFMPPRSNNERHPLNEGSGARSNSDRLPQSPTEVRSSGARNPGGRPPQPPKK